MRSARGEGSGGADRERGPVPVSRLRLLARRLPALAGLVLFVGAVVVVARELHHLHIRDVEAAMRAVPRRALLAAGGCTIAAYFVVTFYDLLATRYAGHPVAWKRTAFASFCAYVLSHNLGVSAVSGGAVRYRLYAAWGLPPAAIARVIAFCSATFLLGSLAIGGAIAIARPHAIPVIGSHLPRPLIMAAGLALWGLVAAYVALSRHLGEIRIRGHVIALPGLRLAIGQVVLAATDVCTTASIAYVLLPHVAGLGYARFLTVYLVSYAAGLLASTPGGLGVFDGAMLLGLSPFMPAPEILGTVLLFRLFYYVVPLFLAGFMFAAHEIYLRGAGVVGRVRPVAARPSRVIRSSEVDLSVPLATGLAALCGALLLGIGAVEPVSIAPLVSLDIDLASLASRAGEYAISLEGAALMVLAIGLSQRVTLAWGATLLMLPLAAALCLSEGQPRWIAAAAIASALIIAPFRRAYYRHARVLAEPLDAGNALPLLALAGSVLALTRVAPDLRYLERNSWWQVVLSSALPDRLRLSVLLLVIVFLYATWRLIKPGRVGWLAWDEGCRRRFSAAGLAPPEGADGVVLGESGRSCVAFRRVGRVLLCLGDPTWCNGDGRSAIWRLRDLAAQEGREAAVLRAGPDAAEAWRAIGLAAHEAAPDGEILCAPDEHGMRAVREVLPLLREQRRPVEVL